jgi:hypothetical protein
MDGHFLSMSDEVDKFLNYVRDVDKRETKPATYIGTQFIECVLWI